MGGGWYHYPRSVPHVSETLRGRVSERRTLPLLGLGRVYARRTQKAFGTAMRLCASLSRGVAAPLGCVICLQLADVAVFSLCAQYFLNVRGGGGITTLGAFHTVRKPCVARYQNGKLCRFWGLVVGAPEERRKPSGQRCAYARRCSEGVAAPLGCVIFFAFVRIVACTPCAQGLSACARHGRYHYPRRALRAVETPDGRLSKQLICRFLRSGGRSSPHDSYFLANTQNFLLAVPVANTFALWYDKFDKLELVISASIFRVLPESNTGQGYVLDKKHRKSILASVYHAFRCIVE